MAAKQNHEIGHFRNHAIGGVNHDYTPQGVHFWGSLESHFFPLQRSLSAPHKSFRIKDIIIEARHSSLKRSMPVSLRVPV